MKERMGITMGDILRRNAHNYPEKLALIDTGSDARITYKQWNHRVNQCAQALIKLGIKKGDKVAIWFFNQREYLETRFAIGKLGAITVPINFRLAAPEMEYIVNQSDAQILIFDQTLMEKVESVRSKLDKVTHYIMAGTEKVPEWTLCYEDVLAGNSDQEPDVEVLPEDEEAILYTSGTTGFPKGAVRTHSSAIWTALAGIFLNDEGFARDSVWVNAMPLFHLGCFECGFMPVMMVGGTNIIVRAFDPEVFLKIVEKEKATGFFIVPAAWAAVVSTQEKKQYDVSSLRFAYSAAAPLPISLEQKIRTVFKSLNLYNQYGSTELGQCNSLSSSAKRGFPLIPSIGRSCICYDVRVLRPDGTDIAPWTDPHSEGEAGEIAVKGPGILKGYYKNPKATEEAFTKDGYLLTGDLAKIDASGNLYIVGRTKEMIISGGENIYPAEVENVISKYPGVADACVIGVPHEKWGETPRAIIALKDGYNASEEEVIKFCKSNLATYKCPTSVVFVDEIPRSSSGKVQKHKLKEMFGK